MTSSLLAAGRGALRSRCLALTLSRPLSTDSFTRLKIYKDPNKAPKELADDEYPSWLWKILQPQPTKEELFREAQTYYDQGGYDTVFEHMSEERLIRLFRIHARDRIKEKNALREGGAVV